MSEENKTIQEFKNDFACSIEIGTPAKGGAMKVYFDVTDVEGSKKRVDNAAEVRRYAQSAIEVKLPEQ